MKAFEKVDLTVTFKNIPVEDAITLKTMFKLYEKYGNMGHSGWVGYYVDGDGAFRPKALFEASKILPNIIAPIIPCGDRTVSPKSSFFDPDTVYEKIEETEK